MTVPGSDQSGGQDRPRSSSTPIRPCSGWRQAIAGRRSRLHGTRSAPWLDPGTSAAGIRLPCEKPSRIGCGAAFAATVTDWHGAIPAPNLRRSPKSVREVHVSGSRRVAQKIGRNAPSRNLSTDFLQPKGEYSAGALPSANICFNFGEMLPYLFLRLLGFPAESILCSFCGSLSALREVVLYFLPKSECLRWNTIPFA